MMRTAFTWFPIGSVLPPHEKLDSAKAVAMMPGIDAVNA